MTLLLAALLLGQVCVEEPLVCPWIATQQLNTAHGVSIVNAQGVDDPGSSLAILDNNARHDGYGITYRTGGVVTFAVDNDGQVFAGSQYSRASFVGYGDGATVGCVAAGGCQVGLLGSMRNYSFHGALVAGNDIPRDGGLAFQVMGTGKPGSGSTVLAVDVLGNTETYGGLLGTYLDPADFGACDGHGWDDTAGTFRHVGMQGYNNDTGRQQICTVRGWEDVCTSSNGLCGNAAVMGDLLAAIRTLKARLCDAGIP